MIWVIGGVTFCCLLFVLGLCRAAKQGDEMTRQALRGDIKRERKARGRA